MELFKLKRGNIETTHKDEIELIHGVEFLKPELKEYGKDIVRYLYTMTSKYFLTHRPLDKLSEPHMALTLSEPEHTILRPELTTILNGQTFPGWVVEVASPQNAEIAYLLKTNLYATAGVKEYWIIDPD
ncbi:MAG: Uma2 family endonuclease, partial [Eubacterium sp.]